MMNNEELIYDAFPLRNFTVSGESACLIFLREANIDVSPAVDRGWVAVRVSLHSEAVHVA